MYMCKVRYENSAVIENKILMVIAKDLSQVASLCEEKLVNHYDESIEVKSITEVDVSEGVAYVVG